MRNQGAETPLADFRASPTQHATLPHLCDNVLVLVAVTLAGPLVEAAAVVILCQLLTLLINAIGADDGLVDTVVLPRGLQGLGVRG
jgi:hypothetical protein